MTTSGPLPFGALLRRHRIAAGLSQEALAERAGISARAISDLERGLYRAPHRDTVAMLGTALGLSAAESTRLEASVVRRRGPLPARVTGRTGQGHALPVPATPLLGRDHEVATITALLLHGALRLVTLLGPGGVGKTRLGLQVAADVATAFADGVVFVALAALTDPALVASAIAQALDVTETGSGPLLDLLTDYLRARRVLLVLDNVEQVLDAASLVAALLARCPGLRVLATSRAPLRLQGEQEYVVPPLAVPDLARLPPEDLAHYAAVQLFVMRAQQIEAGFALTAQTAPLVAAICARLDGLPLAIELAAARVRLFPPQALLSRLDRRLALLVGGPHDLPQRQQTLRATLDWSYSLLTPPQQTLLARLAVFTGGRTLEAIEAICNPEGTLDVLAGLEVLLQQSLLRQEEGVGGEPRYMLLETIHEYARERLEVSGNAAALGRRHALYFLDLAEAAEPELTGPEQGTWLARLEEEHANLRAALSWAREQGESVLGLRLGAVLWRFWLMHAHLHEGRKWLQELLAEAEHDPAAGAARGATPRAKVLRGAAELAYWQGDYGQAMTWGEASLLAHRQVSDQAGIAASLNLLGQVASRQGHHDRAMALYEESLQLYREAGDSVGLATSLNLLGTVAHQEGDYARATALYEESLALRRELHDRRGIASTLNNLGIVAQYQGDYTRAQVLHEESLALRRELGHKWGISNSLNNLGAVAAQQDNDIWAAALYEESLALSRELADRPSIAIALNNLGQVAYRQGNFARARALHQDSLTVYRDLGWKEGTADCLAHMACTMAAQGQPERAAQLWGVADALRQAIGAPMPPSDRPAHERAVAAARTALGAEAFAIAWAAGQSLALEEAIALALEGHAQAPPGP